MLDDILDYMENIRERPVWQPIPDEVRGRFRADLPTAPTDLAAVHAEFMQDILPYSSGNVHPGFMGWVQGGGTPAGMLAEMLAAGLNANLGGRDHAPVEVERQVALWVREIFRFPQTSSGLFVTGTSVANLMGVLLARTAALGADVRRGGVAASDRRLVAYTSRAAHGCIAQAMDLAGLGSSALRLVPTDSMHRMEVASLEQAIRSDREAGFEPFLIVGTAGTVDIGAIDPLEDLARIAAREGMWLHVDGALGALGMLAPDIAPRLAGIERSDSLAFDFHKWGQVPYDAGFFMARDSRRHRETFASPAAYLRRETRGLAAGKDWPCDFGPDLSRSFRALKTWFTLKTYGAEALGRVISHTCELARHLERRIAAEPELELLAPALLNIVCFRLRGPDADALNARVVVELQESGLVAPSSTTLHGCLAIRAAVVNHRTTIEDMDVLVDTVLAFGRKSAARLAA